MARSLSDDFQAVWLLQSKVSFSRLEFWLILAGYDRKTHSFGSRVYLAYVLVFFSVWYFSVLTLLANTGKYIIERLPVGGTLISATTLGALGLLSFFVIASNLSVRSSPWVFSEADANLLCLTPLDRRPIALIWFLKDWLITIILVGSASMVLGYAFLEANALRELTAADLPLYFLAGLRMLAVTIPLLLGAQALAWSPGAFRMNEKREIRWIGWIVPLLSAVCLVAYLHSALFAGDFLPGWLIPLTLPIQAGLGEVSFLPGIGMAMLWMIIGLSCLWKQADGMSLVKAAQESKGLDRIRAAIWMGDTDLPQEMRRIRRLGSGSWSSRFLQGNGRIAVLARDVVQVMRGWSFNQVVGWLAIFSMGLGILLAPEWEARVFLCLLWILAASQRGVRAVRKSLSRWWLVNQLPVPMHQQVALELMLPALGVSIPGMLALGVGYLLNAPVPAFAWLILPAVVTGIALSAGGDILRQCRTSDLLSGIIPDLTLISVIAGALVLGINIVSAWSLAVLWNWPAWGWIPLVLTISASLDYGLYLALQQRVRVLRSPLRE